MSTLTTRSYKGSFSNIQWKYDDEDDHNVKISNTLISIGVSNNSQKEDSGIGTELGSVKLGKNIITLEEYSFYNCRNLKNIDIPNNIQYIKNNSFYQCVNLSSITNTDRSSKFNNSLEVLEIGENAFSYCVNLSSLDLYIVLNTVIGNNTFNWCKQLKEVNFFNNINISENMFEGCSSLTAVNFNDCNSEKNGTIINFGNNVFSNCSSLTSIHLPDIVNSYNSLSPCALANSYLLSIYLDGYDYEELETVAYTQQEIDIKYEETLNDIELGRVYFFDWDKIQACIENNIPMIIFKNGKRIDATSQIGIEINTLLESLEFNEWLSTKPCVFFKTHANVNKTEKYHLQTLPGYINTQRESSGEGFCFCEGFVNRYTFDPNPASTVNIYSQKTLYSTNYSDTMNNKFYPYGVLLKNKNEYPTVRNGDIVHMSNNVWCTSIFNEGITSEPFKLSNIGSQTIDWFWKKDDEIRASMYYDEDEINENPNKFKGFYGKIFAEKIPVQYGDHTYYLALGSGKEFNVEKDKLIVELQRENAGKIRADNSLFSNIYKNLVNFNSIIKPAIDNIINNELKCASYNVIPRATLIKEKNIRYINRNCWGIGHKCTLIAKDGRTFDYDPSINTTAEST